MKGLLLAVHLKRHNLSMRKIETHSISWNLLNLKTRVDTTSFEELQNSIRNLRLQGKMHIAIDMRQNRFLSVPAIQFIVAVARELKEQGGEIVLLAPNEKAKRHFEIYGSLKDIRVLRSGEALELLAAFEASQKSMSQSSAGA